jgi:hypothetical protein
MWKPDDDHEYKPSNAEADQRRDGSRLRFLHVDPKKKRIKCYQTLNDDKKKEEKMIIAFRFLSLWLLREETKHCYSSRSLVPSRRVPFCR